jgi:mycoredoxin
MTASAETIRMYGADWCRDCIRTKKQLDVLGIPYEYINLVDTPDAAEEAREISGRTNIPVVVYPDGAHQVEPTNPEVEAKLRELDLFPG